ncbi:MAG: FkbM family methyltransferase, partial [Acidobacteria bacterium]|nr:FkbM family methyltransferase [Acidobacteriota bacterium]
GSLNPRGMVVALLVTKPGDVVFEIGANIGTETLALSNLLGQSGRVIAVEANPHVGDILRGRVEAAGLTNVTVVNMAVGARDGTANVVDGDASNLGMSYVVEGAGGGQASVPAITADSLVDRFGAPSFVFMDIEGSEYGFLMGAGRLLADVRPIIYSEVIASYLHRSGGDIHAFCSILDKHAYVAFDAGTRSLKEVPFAGVSQDVWGDWLIVPREKCDVVPRIRRALWRARVMPRVLHLNPLDTVPRTAGNR